MTVAAVFFRLDCRGRFLEPDELGVAVRQACPGLASLVEQRMHVRKARVARGSRPLTPGKRDAAHLLVAQVGEGANVARRRDHDFVMFEDRVEIRDDSDDPARCIRLPAARAKRERLRGRSLLTAFAEGARDELFLGR